MTASPPTNPEPHRLAGALDARVLPREVAWFYLRGMAMAASADDEAALTAAPQARELRRLLELFGGSRRVLALGRHDAWTPIALALADPDRRVIFRSGAETVTMERYLAFADAGTRSRIEVLPRDGGGEPLPTVDSALVEGSSDEDDVLDSLTIARGALSTDGVLVVRHLGQRGFEGTERAVSRLALDGSAEPEGLYTWRKPEVVRQRPATIPARRLEPPPSPPAKPRALESVPLPPKPPRRNVRRFVVVGLALAGLAVGAGLGALLTQFDDDEPNGSGTATPSQSSSPSRSGVDPPSGAGSESSASGGSNADRAADERAARRRIRERQRQSRERRARRQGSAGERAGPGAGQEGGGAGGARGGGPSRSVERGSSASFQGKGTRSLGNIRVQGASVLRWTSEPGVDFEISSSGIQLSSTAGRGETEVSRGTYRDFTVKTAGDWTIQIDSR